MPRDTMITSEDIEFVKSQAAFHHRTADRYATDPIRIKRHKEFAQRFDDLEGRLNKILNSPANSVPKAVLPSQLRIGDLNELPPELRDQIKISDSDKLEMGIIQAIHSLNGSAAIDEILVALWRTTDVIQDRDFLARKIYRMVQADTIFSAKKKGFYQLVDPDGEAAFQVEMDANHDDMTFTDLQKAKRPE